MKPFHLLEYIDRVMTDGSQQLLLFTILAFIILVAFYYKYGGR